MNGGVLNNNTIMTEMYFLPMTADLENFTNTNGVMWGWQTDPDVLLKGGDPFSKYFDTTGGAKDKNGKSTTTPSIKDFNPTVKPGETPFLDNYSSGTVLQQDTSKSDKNIPDMQEEKASIDPLLIAAMAVAAFSLK